MATNLELAGNVAKDVAIQSVSLADAIVQSSFDPLAMPAVVQVATANRASYDLKETDPPRLYVRTDFDSKISAQVAEQSDTILRIRASFVLVYSLAPARVYSSKSLYHFAWLNGVYNAWPYWREFAQATAARCGLGAIVMPVYRPKVFPVDEPANGSERHKPVGHRPPNRRAPRNG